jgi:hypothetical protein
MNEKHRPSTMMTPQGLSSDYNWGAFMRGITILDMRLRTTLDDLAKALIKGNENEIAALAIKKKDQEKSLINFLTQAFVETKGAIAQIDQFDPKSENYINLAIEDKGQLLWLKIENEIEQKRDETQRKFEEIIPERE